MSEQPHQVYLVWDWDSLASSMGEPVLVAAYTSLVDAQAEADRLNEAARQRWNTAAPGRENETWNWKRANVRTMELR
jgi:hypothetical protein